MPNMARVGAVTRVAPFTGAWIEIDHAVTDVDADVRRTLHGCVD